MSMFRFFRNTLRFAIAASLAFVMAAVHTRPTNADSITYEMVTVGNPGNAADATGFGAVNYEYRIGKYEVTNGQYAAFLNAVAKSDPYGLWSETMAPAFPVTDYWGSFAGYIYPEGSIRRYGSEGSYSYSVHGAGTSAQLPASIGLWTRAARFANWMHNGQPTGPQSTSTTEAGAYTLNGQVSGTFAARNPDARFFIPTENEWYKAAYYDPTKESAGGYWQYATRSDASPGNTLGSLPNQANYYISGWAVGDGSNFANYRSPVGAFSASPSYYGTFDQSGNLAEWNDLSGISSDIRGHRGGSYFSGAPYVGVPGDGSTQLSTLGRGGFTADSYVGGDPYTTTPSVMGLRLAAPIAPVPEPSTYAMALAGLACGGFSMWRRRKRA